MPFFDRKYLSEQQLKGFDKYKYSCIDSSPIAVYISHPFWNWFVNFYPEWLAPNVLTLAGALLVMGCYWLVAYFDYYFEVNSSHKAEQFPSWIWVVCGVSTFLAHTLDGTDGKQARRTGASGPTGELFDHGLDSWSTVPFTLTIFSLFGQGEYSITPVRLLCVLISVQLVFIVTHWEKYNTGVMFLSWAYDASQYGLSLFYLFAYVKGPDYFKYYVFPGYTFAHCFEISFYVCCVFSFLMSFYNMYLAYFVDKTGKQSNVFEAFLPMISPSILFGSSLLWAIYSPQGLINQNPRLFFWTMGVVFSNIAVRLIIAQMSCNRAEIMNPLLGFYILIVFGAVGGFFDSFEMTVLQVSSWVLTLAHIHYGVCVVKQLCDHFNIYAFNLSYLQKPTKHE
ncbi:unnamed protein product [Bursaphelenchus xylophilus]|uniref:(pine wood nematode) hypothetical protein n=1 Tax=Bursaphelenchus xylophilus TaxID=6326 RepID=A0A7I8XHQ3_BURXY|nr:unnamed protein product [Bursaphelenchus xylophilus]CAG9084659.1 unnamed protein product [Bursaphelenchus xylophilus]